MMSIHELFVEQVARTPEGAAVVFGENSLTYRQLDQRSDRLAHQLRELGVGSDVLVALYLERSLEMVVAMLGVLKAGGAYVPMDSAHPRQRLAAMLANAEPLVLLTQTRLLPDLPPHRANVLAMDVEAAAPEPAPSPSRATGARDLAYVIYTSGSTGEPKGVEIEHASVVNMLTSMQRRPGLGAEDAMLGLTTLAFDIAVLEIFLPLTCGARVVIADRDAVTDAAALIDLIERSGVSVMQATPATLQMLLDAGWQGSPKLKKILCGGEAWTAELASRLLPRCGSLWNMYGPTETTVWSAVSRVQADQPVAIGPPIANTRFYVLDGGLQLVPVGVPGELYIGGQGLARGYWRRPELTRERFVADPFAPQSGARMYRTGDLVRRQPNGALEFLGRLDHQVKIRGHRIELGEIEAALARLPGIERCLVVAREDAPGDRQLVAYVIPAAGAAVVAGELRLRLSETLPAYMIPAAFVSLAAFPLSPSGKIDRKALPPPNATAPETDAAVAAPRTPTEQALARIFCKMLSREQVGVGDNFFDLGGHSLLAVRVIGEINKSLKVRLPVPVFFQNPTIEALSEVVERARGNQCEAQVLTLQSGRTGLPIYFMGARQHEYRLARTIGKDRTIYAINIPMPQEWHQAIDAEDRLTLPTIQRLGELYGDVLRAHAKSSPCVIVGYSLGGKIAFEASRELQRAGGKVALVLLIDARAFSSNGATSGPARRSLQWIWRNSAVGGANDTSHLDRLSAMLGDSWRLLRWLLARTPQVVKHRLSRKARISDFFDNEGMPILSGYLDKDGKPIEQIVIDRLIRFASKSWRPKYLDAPGVLFRANEVEEEILPGYDFSNGWRDLFPRGLEIVQAAGDHVSMVLEENVDVLARQITAVLARYEATGQLDFVRRETELLAGAPVAQHAYDLGRLQTASGHRPASEELRSPQ